MSGIRKAQCAGKVVQYNAVRVQFCPAGDPSELQGQLQELAKEIIAGLSEFEPAQSRNLLGVFVSDLFLSAADQSRRKELRQKQAKGIAAAKAQGVQFGPARKPLPDNFDEFYRKWRDGKISMREAAQACGMPKSSFYGAAMRKEQSDGYAV